jgi:catalase
MIWHGIRLTFAVKFYTQDGNYDLVDIISGTFILNAIKIVENAWFVTMVYPSRNILIISCGKLAAAGE